MMIPSESKHLAQGQ